MHSLLPPPALPCARSTPQRLLFLLLLLFTCVGFALPGQASARVKVFILAGQSNMQGHGKVTPIASEITKNGGMGSLKYLVDNPSRLSVPYELTDSSGNWTVREDVRVAYLDRNRIGPLTVGYGAENDRIGPEFGFGQRVGAYFNEPVLLIKTAWGGKSLYEDFRPPSSGRVGASYTLMVSQVRQVLNNLRTYVPTYQGDGYDIVGVAWHQGWNDRINTAATNEYQLNCVNLINDLRQEFQSPELPFIIATTGMGGWALSEPQPLALIEAQLSVPLDDRLKSRKNVVAVDTRDFWRRASESPSDFEFHWNHNGETYLLIGDAMGEAMVNLLSSSTGTVPPPGGTIGVDITPPGYTKCTDEGGSCRFNVKVDVAYGARGEYKYQYGVTGKVVFNNTTLTDPIPGIPKSGYYKAAVNTTQKFRLDVVNGSGDGSYKAGKIITLVADAPAANQVFDRWVVDAGNPAVSSLSNPTMLLTVPTQAVRITATYRNTTPPPISGPAGYTWCVNEGGVCNLSALSDVAYGSQGRFVFQNGVSGAIRFDNATFGTDPNPGQPKAGFFRPAANTNYRSPENPSGTVAGLLYQYYQGNWENLPNFASLPVIETGSRSSFDINGALSGDYFGYVFSGYINIPRDGVYTFYLNSDDGSRLSIGNTAVVINDGIHPSLERSGQIGLRAGRHAIRVDYFENRGGVGLQVFYEGPSLSKQLIPASALSRMPKPDAAFAIQNATTRISRHIQGLAILSDAEIANQKAIIDSNIANVGYDLESISSAFDLVSQYERIIGPLFINDATRIDGWGWDRRTFQPDIHTTLLSVMQGIVDRVYTPANIAKFESRLRGFNFRSSEHFPGKVTAIPDPNQVHTTRIDASYLKTFGHLIMHADLPARKPTGTYLAPGSIASVTVPQSLVNTGYAIRVGAHSYDLSSKPFVRRLDRSSIGYPITSTVTKIASPLGGGIYIEVPYLANAGNVDIRVQNAVRSPFFSMQSFKTTSLSEWQNIERRYGAPWADFQTEKFMMQVPTSWITNYAAPAKALADWDKAMDAVSDLMGYPALRGKEVLYEQVDVIIRAGAYSPGYPQVNETYDPRQTYNGNVNNFLLTGPASGADVEFHELGHGHLFQKFPGEVEAAVNLLYVPVLTQKFGKTLDQAFHLSLNDSVGKTDTLATTAFAWMASDNFRLGRPMEAIEMQYQYFGHAKYVEIAKQFGWGVLGNYWRSINQEYENTTSPTNTVPGSPKIDDTNNGLMLRMSRAAGVDIAPLIHFWGTQPNNVSALRTATAQAGLPASAKIYDMLMAYRASVPNTNQEFRTLATKWWGKQPSASGYKTEAYHAGLWNTWNESYANTIKQNVQNIVNLYFPNGRP